MSRVVLAVDALRAGRNLPKYVAAIARDFPGQDKIELLLQTSAGSREARIAFGCRVDAAAPGLAERLDQLLGDEGLYTVLP